MNHYIKVTSSYSDYGLWNGKQQSENKTDNPPECCQPALVCIHIMLQWCCFALSKAVDVKDGYKIVKTVVASKVQCLPDRAFSALSVANQTVYSVPDLHNNMQPLQLHKNTLKTPVRLIYAGYQKHFYDKWNLKCV